MKFRAPSEAEWIFYFDYNYLRHPLSWVLLAIPYFFFAIVLFDFEVADYFGKIAPGILMAALIVSGAVRINPKGNAGGGRLH